MSKITGSQRIAIVLLVVFIIFYFAAVTTTIQNAFLFLFVVTGIVLIVGRYFLIFQTVCLWTIRLSIMNRTIKIGRKGRCLIDFHRFVMIYELIYDYFLWHVNFGNKSTQDLGCMGKLVEIKYEYFLNMIIGVF